MTTQSSLIDEVCTVTWPNEDRLVGYGVLENTSLFTLTSSEVKERFDRRRTSCNDLYFFTILL